MKVIETSKGDCIQICRGKQGKGTNLIFIPKKTEEKARSLRSITDLINWMKKRNYDLKEINKVVEGVEEQLIAIGESSPPKS